MRNILLLVMALLAVVSCKNKDKNEDIIVEKVIEKPQDGPESMAVDEQTGSVRWINDADYSCIIKREPDKSLPVVTNHDVKYYDNSINLMVKRADGSVFFEKTFTKENFAPVLPKEFKENGVLLGINFEKREGNELLFVVSVGSPDETNEEFYYARMSLSNLGATKAMKYTTEGL